MGGVEAEAVAARSLLPPLADADQVVGDLGVLDLPAADAVLARGAEPTLLRGSARNGCSKPGSVIGMSRITRIVAAWAASTSARRVATSPKFLSTCS